MLSSRLKIVSYLISDANVINTSQHLDLVDLSQILFVTKVLPIEVNRLLKNEPTFATKN